MQKIIILLMLAVSQLFASGENNKSKEDFEKFLVKEFKVVKSPGMAIAVIKGNEVVFQKCFGVKNTKNNKPVDENTIFAIGSSSKPFTALLTASEVEKGNIEWDDPVTKYLPDFKLNIIKQNENDEVTIRDLLSHRTGFFHMPLIGEAVNWGQDPDWGTNASEEFTREKILEKAVKFSPQDTFRTKHNYSNVGMIAAAEATAKAAGDDWDVLMKKYLFSKLNMINTSTSVSKIDKNNAAIGYMKSKEGVEESLMINLDGISPAGGINSSLSDMTNFIKFLLNNGKFNNKEIIKKESIEETWKVHIKGAEVGGMLPGRDYGLGWFISDYKGYKVVEHPGNTIGFSSNIVLIPELKIGFVILSNLMPNKLQVTLTEKIWEYFIKEE